MPAPGHNLIDCMAMDYIYIYIYIHIYKYIYKYIYKSLRSIEVTRQEIHLANKVWANVSPFLITKQTTTKKLKKTASRVHVLRPAT